ncbi:esterase family protein [Microbacterium sp. 1.5R]|uniref:alpha/beta hydrolase n=1 Tax=Microbacterium sp. 1.5R TaxID=1916917 RepID=UPI0021B1606B|nr:alpha/beta hydrolase-fold protein [Microbacterium sp. 1.5R]
MWSLPVIDGPVPVIVYGAACVFFLVLLLRRPRRAWVLTVLVALLVGALVGSLAALVADLTDAFGTELPGAVFWWASAVFAAIALAIANLRRSRAWRKVVAVVGIVVFAITGVIGVNAYYGLNPTLGSLFGVVTSDPIAVPTNSSSPRPAAGPLYKSFTPPAGMPTKGKQGTQVIPATASGFDARPAGVYLPPAALVEDAPALPLVIMMMGFPGDPDPQYIASALDDLAAENKGLAPIVIVADQIGPSGNDPACADSTAYGDAETYITKDVVDWARKNLNVIQDPKYWVIAGYSNGGGCAVKYLAQQPQTWKNLLDISGEEFPGSEDVDSVTSTIYGGSGAAFEASKPISIMKSAAPGTYDGVTAVFTVGAQDPPFIPAAKAVSAEAKAVGMTTTYYEVPGAGHVVDALNGGLQKGLALLYPVLGLSAP